MMTSWTRSEAASSHRAGGCGCRRCAAEEQTVERLARESLSVALRHAQEQWDGAEAATGPELPLPDVLKGRTTLKATDFKLSYTNPFLRLTDIMKGVSKDGIPKREGSLLPNYFWDAKERVYSYWYTRSPNQPYYVGKVSGRPLIQRLHEEVFGKKIGKTSSSDTRKLYDWLESLKDEKKSVYVVSATYTSPTYTVVPDITRAVEALFRGNFPPRFHNTKISSFEDEE